MLQKPNFSDQFLAHVATKVHDVVRIEWSFRRRVFLCGGSPSNRDSLRRAIRDFLVDGHQKIYEVHYPEILFDDLLTGVGRHDLLSLENLLADSVSVVVIALESPGAIAELGAFANHAVLKEKLIVVQERQYERDRSFVQLGPIRLLRTENPDRVVAVDRANLANDLRRLTRSIDQIVPWNVGFDATPHLNNPFEAVNFLLPCLYVLQVLQRNQLKALLCHIEPKLATTAEAVVAAALSLLRSERAIAMTGDGYQLTSEGCARVKGPPGRRPSRKLARQREVLDALRIEMLNIVCREWKKEVVSSVPSQRRGP